MDTAFLESLIAVVETGSIAAAAREQAMTAAAVSQRIRVLENDLKMELLQRSAHSASPTTECLALLPKARELVALARSLSCEWNAADFTGPFRLGAISTALYDYVPAAARSFSLKAPKAHLFIKPGSSEELFRQLQARELDAILSVQPPFKLPKSVICHAITEQAWVLIRPIGLSHEVPLPWIIYDSSSWGGRQIISELRGNEEIFCELDSLETIAFMVEAGLGQALVPNWRGLVERHHGVSISSASNNMKNNRKICFMRIFDSPLDRLSNVILHAIENTFKV